jgi:hypothetical protein
MPGGVEYFLRSFDCVLAKCARTSLRMTSFEEEVHVIPTSTVADFRFSQCRSKLVGLGRLELPT